MIFGGLPSSVDAELQFSHLALRILQRRLGLVQLDALAHGRMARRVEEEQLVGGETQRQCHGPRFTMAGKAFRHLVAEAHAGGKTGLGYTYADTATGELIRSKLREVVQGRDALNVQAVWIAMVHAIRNLGGPGISSMAISAVDNALWDLKARLLGLPLAKLLGQVRDGAPRARS